MVNTILPEEDKLIKLAIFCANMKKAKELRFYFTNVSYEVQEWRKFPKNLTIALPRNSRGYRGSYIIIANNYDEESIYIGKVYNVRQITTFDQAISIREITKIKLDLEKLLNTNGNFARDISITDYPVLLDKNISYYIMDEILTSNKGTICDSYFSFERIISNGENPLFTEFVDSFILALNIFGFDNKHMPVVNEKQILNYNLNTIFPNIRKSINGDYFFEYLDERLTIKAIHSLPISECFGIDLIYYFNDEGRAIFIRYECLDNSKNKLTDTSIDYVCKHIPIAKSIPDIAECYNFKVTSQQELRICKCPIYIKLCSRQIKDHRYIPSGVYYPICVWNYLYKNNKYMSFDSYPKISHNQFLELIGSRLIGSNLIQYEQIENYLSRNNEDKRLKLIFIQSKIYDKY